MNTFQDPFPDVVRIEPAGRCNLRCMHCPVGIEGGKRDLLSLKNFITLFDRLPFVPRVLVLYHGGEPLLNGDLPEMIAHAKGRGVVKTVLNTNALLLDQRTAEALYMLDEMRVSFDGDSAEENNQIRRGARFSIQCENVKKACQSVYRPKHIVIFNARKNSSLPASYLMDAFRGYRVEFRATKIKKWARQTEKMNTNSQDQEHCLNMFQTFTMLSNGDVVLCCEDLMGDVVQGNAFQKMPAEIWNDMQKVRDAFSSHKYYSMCLNCWVLNND